MLTRTDYRIGTLAAGWTFVYAFLRTLYVEHRLFVLSQVHLILYHIRSHSLLRTRSGSISVRVSPQASIRRTVTVLSVAAERWLPLFLR